MSLPQNNGVSASRLKNGKPKKKPWSPDPPTLEWAENSGEGRKHGWDVWKSACPLSQELVIGPVAKDKDSLLCLSTRRTQAPQRMALRSASPAILPRRNQINQVPVLCSGCVCLDYKHHLQGLF